MNYSIVLYILGCVLKFESAFLVLPALVGLIYREHASVSYLAVAVLCLILGVLLTHKKPRSTNLYTREGFVAVALSWIIMSIFGAIPFVLTEIFRFMWMHCLRRSPVLLQRGQVF